MIDAHAGRSAPAGLHDLMDRYLDGDGRAFAALHAILDPRLKAFLMKLVRDSAAADDLVQATWLKAHLASARFEIRGSSPDGAVQAWYFTIARNLALDHLRGATRDRRRLEPNDPTDDPVSRLADQVPTAEEEQVSRAESEDLTRRVQAALAQLPDGQREIVELHKLQGMSMAEIAARLQLREGAVRVRAHRAYKALARWLGPIAHALVTTLVGGGRG